MKKIIFTILLFVFLFSAKPVSAVYDPLSAPNNKIGIHILFPTELSKARAMINTNGGDWGYVTIPIQAGDKDINKWQKFFNDCRQYHLIPIVRLATEGDFFNTTTWRIPTDDDTMDFANFLNSLNWPTKNRYIIVYNEVNRADEWGGKADPDEYAKLLSYAVTIFKSKSQDFFIISSGMDNAAIGIGPTYNEYNYFTLMNQAVPGIFNQIDGFSSHSYPNPGFSQSPKVQTPESISSFSYETDSLSAMSNKKLPVFITETGWDQNLLGSDKVISYFKEALTGTWSDSQIVAITPFLLSAGQGPFEKFTFVKDDEKTSLFKAFADLPKTKGSPKLTPVKKVLGENDNLENLPVKDFSNDTQNEKGKALKTLVKWLFVPF